MALDTNIVGALSGTGADVNTARQLKVTAETDIEANPGNVGAVRAVHENDAGSVTGTALLRSPEVSDDYRVRVGVDTILMNDIFSSNTQNTHLWSYTAATLTAAMPGAGTVNFSAVQGTTSAHGAFMRTYQHFPLIGTTQIWHETRWGMFTAPLVANEVWSCGFGLPGAATTLPTDGVWWQLTSAGLIGRLCTNGAFTDSGVLKAFGDFTVGEIHKYSICVTDKNIQWWEDDVLLGTTVIPSGNGQPCISQSLPAFFMKHNTGNVSNTNTMRVSDIVVSLGDIASNKPWGHQLATSCGNSTVAQNGATQGKTQWWTNNSAPTPAAATNTAVISGASTLGGLVTVNPTLTANNDGILFSYQVPISNNLGKNLVITGVKVQGAVVTVFVGGPVIYAYAIAYGQTAESLATTETASFATATTHAPRIVFIGMESYAATAAAGTLGAGCTLDLSSAPIVVRPAERIALIARNMGTVTSSGAVTVGCSFIGYWE